MGFQKFLISFFFGIPAGIFACTATWNDGSSNWNNAANWTPNCVPHLAGDTATFNSPGGIITQDVGTITLLSLTFLNNNWTIQDNTPGAVINTNSLSIVPSASFTNLNSNSVLGVVGTTGNTLFVNSSITLDTGTSLINQNDGAVDGTGSGISNEGVLIDAPELIINGGNYSNVNNGLIATTALGASGAVYTSSGGITITSGTITNNNASGVGSGSQSVGADLGMNTSFTMNGGTVLNTNSGLITNGVGSLIQAASLTIAGGTFTNENHGTTFSPGIGSELNLATSITISGGEVINQNLALNTDGIGVEISTGLLNITGGSITNTNSSSTSTTGIGSEIAVTTFTMSSGIFLNTNTAPTTNNIGIFFQQDSANISGGSLTFQNNGPVNLAGGGANGCSIGQGTVGNNYVIDGGNVTFSNTSAIDNKNNGTILAWGGGSVIVNSGSLTNSNSGTIGSTTSGGIGSDISCSDMTITGGTFTNINTGTVEGATASSFGAAAFPNTLEISGGTLLNQNSGSVANPNLNFGAVVSAITRVEIGSPSGICINNDLLQSPIINVSSGGTLAGTGTYTGFNDLPTLSVTTDVTNSGNVEPFNGSTPGTMTISGSYIQTAQGTFTADLLNSSTFSQLSTVTNGPTELAGTLNVNFLPNNTVSVNDTFVIIKTTANDLSGTFSRITSNSPNLTPHVSYIFGFDGEVILSFTAAMPTTYAGGFIETVLSDINHLNSHALLRMEDLRRNFFEISSNYLANLTASTKMLISQNEKQEQLRREVVSTEKTTPGRIYFGPVARSSADLHTKNDQPGLEFWSIGGLVGFDYAFSEIGIGIMSEYERISAHAKQNWGKIEVDQFYACFYTTYAPICLPELALNAIVGGAYEKYYIKRNTGTAASPLVAFGKPSGFGVDGLFGLEYVIEKCLFQFIPLANVQYIYLKANSYQEHGAGPFDLNVGHQTVQSLRTSLGARVNYVFQKNCLVFIPEIYGSWQREYLNRHRHIGLALADLSLTSTTLIMPGTSRNIALGGVDLLFNYYQFSIEGNYEFEYNVLYHDHFFYVGVDYRF